MTKRVMILLGTKKGGFILDGDEAHIVETIIDGSRPRDSLQASVVTIGPADTTCDLMGFTIRRGLGTFHHATRGQYNWISGGGVFILNAGARVAYNRIVQNRLTTRWKHNRTFGAGLACELHEQREKFPLRLCGPLYLIRAR